MTETSDDATDPLLVEETGHVDGTTPLKHTAGKKIDAAIVLLVLLWFGPTLYGVFTMFEFHAAMSDAGPGALIYFLWFIGTGGITFGWFFIIGPILFTVWAVGQKGHESKIEKT